MPELPTTFGKYYLTEKLATGGMAEIYLAKLIGPGGFEKLIVIKQILPRLSGQRHFVDLFVAEAKTLVTLAHGNIVPVYELGVVDDTYFIAMDYIDGPTLYRLTEIMARREARIDPPVAAYITARILDGLDYAHRKGEGVIHRDLSPRNVMLSRDGEVKLVDFGIAVTLGDDATDESNQSAPTGSFPYMSPEQVRKEPLTTQTDLFSAGVLAWEMLTGERLFARPDPDATLAAVKSGEIPLPSSHRPEIPAKLDDIVMKALEREPAARWANAGEMVAALNKYLYSLDATPGPRDVAALVAQFCPPETRRMPTHADADIDHARPAGPSTAVIPRDAAPRGKPKRAQTFATHIELEELLGPSTKVSEPGPEPRPGIIAPKLDVQKLSAPPSRALLIVAGLAAIGMAGAVVYMFFDNRDRVLAMGDGGVRDGKFVLPDAPQPIDAAPEIDAGLIDAGAKPVRDASAVIARPDAGARPDAAVAATGTATLVIGADPWAKIFIDGKERRQTPATITVPAGHHELKLVNDAESPPRVQPYSIDLEPGETKKLQADFTH
ncbi:MAG TPA: serine/threonine-protein kinase [Kofleriaceae bacterium]